MMGLVREMGWWLSGHRSHRTAFLLVALIGLTAPALSAAQAVSASERDALVKLRTDRGGQATDVDVLLRLANEAAAKGMPLTPLINKIREGLAKGADPKRIEGVVRQMASHLETADRLLRESSPTSPGPGCDALVALLAEAIGGGVTEDEVLELRRASQAPGQPPSTSTVATADSVASAAKGLSFIKEARLPAPEGAAVITAAVRQGYRSHELLDLGREVKRREVDYRAGRASLRSLRDAIARGDRPDQLFRDSRPAAVERPAAARPETPVERPTRPEPPQRPEPVRPEPVRPDRPATGRD